jgi:O-antigen/teichoic acid export membrane protein
VVNPAALHARNMYIVSTILRWVRVNSVMLTNAGALIGTTAVTSLLGFVYWWLAARRFPPEEVGVASASVSAMVLLGGFCVLGLGTLLITELPRQPGQAASLISTSLTIVGAVGAMVGFVFAIVAPFASSGFKELGVSLANVALFAAGVSLTAMAVVLDQSLVGLLRGKLQFGRNALFASAKLVALFGLSIFSAGRAGVAIYATWALGIVISLVALAAYLLCKTGWQGGDYLPRWSLLRKLGGAALQHHMLNMTLQAPVLMLPLLVTALLSATMNAWFYVSWMIVNFVFLVPNTLTIVLHAMNSAQQTTLAHKARVTLAVGLATSLLANCVLQVAAKQALSLFGASYAQQATWTLRVLLLAAFPLTIKYHYIAICRIQDRIKQAMLGMLPGGLLELSAAALGARLGGLTGLSAGWVVAIYIEALFMFRTVVSTVRAARAESDVIDRLPARLAHTAQIPVMEPNYLGGDAIWLMDTISMPIVRLTAIKKANKEIECRQRERGFQSPWRINRGEHEEQPFAMQSVIPASDGTGSHSASREK